jgi:hypothetical protein
METKKICPPKIAEADEFKQYKDPSQYGAKALFRAHKLQKHKNNPNRASNQEREGKMYIDASMRQLNTTQSNATHS